MTVETQERDPSGTPADDEPFGGTGSPQATQAACAVCRSPILHGARKCIQCGSYQSFLGRILAGIDLQALVALVPIVTLAFVFLKGQWVTHESNIQATLLYCSSDAAHLFVSNAGDRAAVVKGAAYRLEAAGEHEDGADKWKPLELSDRSLEGLLVDPGDSQLLILRPTPIGAVRPKLIAPTYQGPECRLHVRMEAVAFDHTPSPQATSCACTG